MTIEAAVTGRLGQSAQHRTSAVAETEPVGKMCRCCRTDRPIAAFFPCRSYPDGYLDKCRACIAATAQRDREERERRRTTLTPRPRRSVRV